MYFLNHITAGVVVTSLFMATSAISDSEVIEKTETPFSLKVQYELFEWKEYGLDGKELLKESGYRLGLRWDRRTDDWSAPDWAAHALLYFGNVDYDGQSQIGEPVDSTTEYYGGLGESSLYLPLYHANQLDTSFFTGGGIHSWLRKLDNTGGFTDTDYNEWWFSTYLQAGAAVRWKRETGTLIGRTGIRYPVYNRVEYDFVLPDGSSDVSVEPGNDAGYFAELDYESGGYVFGIYFEEWNFKRSDTKSKGGANIFQPESKQQSVGVQFGISY